MATKKKHRVTLELPSEFVALCARDKVAPEIVLRGFIADLCEIRGELAEGYQSSSDERMMAQMYYDRASEVPACGKMAVPRRSMRRFNLNEPACATGH